MKKILALTLCLILAGVMFTACGSDNNSSEPEVTTTVETTTTPEETTLPEEVILPDETTPSGDEVTEPVSDNPLAAFGTVAEKAAEWPSLMEVTDPTMLKDTFLLDAENPNYKAVLAKLAMISAASGQYIIIEAVDGKVDDAIADLEAYKKKLIEQDAFYAAQQEDAKNSIVGKTGNYAYFIAFEEAPAVEKALVEALEK